jgi:hypothetical protein
MTYCIAIEQDIVISTCPLRKGACYWQHRETKLCAYTAEEISIEDYCKLVSLPVITEVEREAISNAIKIAVSSA